MVNNPKISIVTVVFNACNTLESTILSVITQKNASFEYWVIDGGSSDGSLDIIKKYKNCIDGWISEPDKGIYDAMNKGIQAVKGDWIYFLGADDTLKEGSLELVQPKLEQPYSVVFGDVLFDNGSVMRSFLGLRTLLQNTVHHQSAFYHKSNFESFIYDSSLKIIADYELNLKIYVEKKLFKYVNVIVSKCATGGASSQLLMSLKETNIIRGRYLKNYLACLLLNFILYIYYLQKIIRYKLYGHTV